MPRFDWRLSFVLSFVFPLTFLHSTSVSAHAQGQAYSSSPARLAGTIDESSLIALRGNTHPLAEAKYDRGPASASMPANRLLLVLARSTEHEAALETYLESTQDANSPNYHRFLSPEDFGKSFGVGDADIETVQTWLTGHGFTVNRIAKSRMAIEFSGSVGQVQSTFHTSIHSFVIDGVQQWANVTDPQIPSALAPVVAGLASLNSFKPRAQYIKGPSGTYDAQKHTITPAYTLGDTTNGYYIYLGPADAATIYNTPTSLNANLSGTAYDGTGVTIGVAGDSNIDITQNANYRATFGLAAKATTVVVDGDDPGENGDAVEAYLDTQVSGGLAPNANIILYTAEDTEYESGLFLAIQRALDDNQADILNVSFSGCESAQGAAGNLYIQNLWEQAAAQGISVVVSSGDAGSAGCDNPDTEQWASQGLAVNGIASTPYNISVGGTDYDTLYSNFPSSFTNYIDITNTLANHRSALSYIPEEPWNDSTFPNTNIAENVSLVATTGNSNSNNILAGGGGISGVYAAPSWQSSFATGGYRNLPDVSLLAGNGLYGALWGICTDQEVDQFRNPVADCAAGATGSNFNLTGVGGTSAAAPAFAGMLALVKQKTGSRLGQANYAIYGLAKSKYSTVFHDVTTGDNSVNCFTTNGGCSKDAKDDYFMNGYNAAAGYDMASGLGSVNAGQMLSNWAGVGFTATTSSLELNGGTAAINITHGQSVTVSDSVTSGSGTPSGNIALVDTLSPATQPNSEGIADFTLTNGSISGTTDSLPGGSYQVSAHYGGSGTYAQSDSNAISVNVGAESSTTNLKVVGYYDPATGKAATTPYYGFLYLLDAQPYGNSASLSNPNGAATGTITFMSGSATLGTAAIGSNGIAELQTTTIPGGSDSLAAAFPGDKSFLTSTSAAVPFTVVPAVTTLRTPTSQPSYASPGSPMTLSATLSADSAGAAPTGTVSFMNGSATIGTAPMAGTAATSTAPASGTATYSTSSLLPGNYNLTAVYGGDSNYAGSTSAALSFDIAKADPTLVATPSSTSIHVDQPLQFTVSLAAVGGLPTPTGSVSLEYGNPVQFSPTVNLVNGTASLTIPANALPLGVNSIAAGYDGDSVYRSASSTVSVTVNSTGTITPTITVTAPTVTVTYPFSFTVTASGPSGDPTPTGSILYAVGSGSYGDNGSKPLANGSVTITPLYQLPGGPNTISVTYLGDSNYTSGIGSATVDLFEMALFTFTPSYPTITVNQSLSMTVTLGASGGYPTPTGTLTLSSGTNYTSSPVQLAAGSASFTIPANSLPIGANTVIASYSGDSYYRASSDQNPVFVTSIPPPGFAITGTTVTIPTAGATSGNTSNITVTPSNGFTGSVALTAVLATSPANAVSLPTFSFGSTTPVNITGTANGTATLTVTTTAASSGGCSAANQAAAGHRGRPLVARYWQACCSCSFQPDGAGAPCSSCWRFSSLSPAACSPAAAEVPEAVALPSQPPPQPQALTPLPSPEPRARPRHPLLLAST